MLYKALDSPKKYMLASKIVSTYLFCENSFSDQSIVIPSWTLKSQPVEYQQQHFRSISMIYPLPSCYHLRILQLQNSDFAPPRVVTHLRYLANLSGYCSYSRLFLCGSYKALLD